MQSIKGCRKDFPILSKKIIYLDNASTTQKPKSVIESMNKWYSAENANVHRGLYQLSQEASKYYDKAREKVAKFIGSEVKEIIFTKGTTDSLNLLAYSLPSIINSEKNEIVITEVEHHANLIPWQQLAKRAGFILKFIKIDHNFEIDYLDAEKKITPKTAIVSLTAKSNVFGTRNDIKRIIDIAKKRGALTIVDAAQIASHSKIEVNKLGCDFLAFSGHKMYGPMGIGILYGKKELLDKMSPVQFGGDMIREVSYESATWAQTPEKFEAGTPNVQGALGISAAIDYINNIGLDNISKYERELGEYALSKLKQIPSIQIYGTKGEGIISFNISGVHSHGVSSLLDDSGICIRAGNHCAMPIMNKLGLTGTCRLSLSFYNTQSEIEILVKELIKIKEIFNDK